MDPTEEVLLIMGVLFALFALIIYVLFRMLGSKNKMKDEIRSMFNARDYGDGLRFKYRNYDVLVTFRPDVKVSILHGKNVEEQHSPPGAQLTPMYLIFRIRKSEEIVGKLDKYVDFLDSIPTQ
ncbi:MAG: hypothetical protein GXO25_00850 [Euryarchaeota archaeon]|nr:hypothetical protein [Euryarchaeota archaeon]